MPQANLGGGAETMLLHFLHGLRAVRPQWECRVAFLKKGPAIQLVEEAGFVAEVLGDVRLRSPWRCWKTWLALTRTIARQQSDVVLSWAAYGHLFGGLAAAWMGVPAIWYQIAFARGWLDHAATKVPARAIIAVSEHVASLQNKIRPRRATTIVWPGIDLKVFEPASDEARIGLREKLGLSQQIPIAVMVGRLQRWKGMHTAITAMPQVISRFPDAQLWIVGGKHDTEPDYPAELAKMVAQLGLDSSVHFVGIRNDIADWMNAADVVIHASQEEPFGIVAVEAMACGRPVITGNDGGVCEAVRDGIEGFHVAYEDSARLGERLVDLFGDHIQAALMGERGLARADHFGRERYAGEICSVLVKTTAR